MFEGFTLLGKKTRIVRIYSEFIKSLLEYKQDAEDLNAPREYREQCRLAARDMVGAMRKSLDEFESSL